MVVLREKKRKSHIFHDCLYVRLRRGDEHQSLLHDKHLLGNNYVRLGKTRKSKLKQGKRRRSISLRYHLLPSCQSRLLEKIVFVLEMPSLRVDLKPRLYVLCQGAVAHHEHLGEFLLLKNLVKKAK